MEKAAELLQICGGVKSHKDLPTELTAGTRSHGLGSTLDSRSI